MTRTRWALLSAVVFVAGFAAFATASGVRWGWPALILLTFAGVRIFLWAADAGRAAYDLGGRLRARRDARTSGNDAAVRASDDSDTQGR